MITITTTCEFAKDTAKQIHDWRKANIQGYNATSWDNENLSDEEFDKLHKSFKAERWFIFLPAEDEGINTQANIAMKFKAEKYRAEDWVEEILPIEKEIKI